MPQRRLTASAAWTAAAAGMIVFWLPSTQIPLWQDDYIHLVTARDARLAGLSWLDSLAPDPASGYWRPIGTGLWWRFVECVLGGDPVAAHAAALLVLVLSALAVGWLAGAVRDALAGNHDQPLAAPASAFLYGIHASHLLPASWVSASNDSLAVLFGALALGCWMVGSRTGRRSALAISVASFAVAMACRESAIIVPVLGALLTWWTGSGRPLPPRARLAAASAALVAMVWLIVRMIVIPAAPVGYQLRVGANVVRNALSLGVFALNGPREAIRFLLTDPSAQVAAWGIACVALQAAAVALMVRSSRPRLDRQGAAVLALCAVVGCGPFLLLAWNSYAYYTSFALVAYAIVAALAVGGGGRALRAACLLALTSAGLSVAGNYRLDYPALFARAAWGERQLEQIVEWHAARQSAVRTVYVKVDHDHRFEAFGVSGLAYRLGLATSAVIVLEPGAPPPDDPVIVVSVLGDVTIVRSPASAKH